jgi:hypothetical protein
MRWLSGSLSGSMRSASWDMHQDRSSTGGISSGSLRSGSGGGISGGNIGVNRAREWSGSGIWYPANTVVLTSEKTEITIGISSNGKTEVISGLEVGDVIITIKSSWVKTVTWASTSNSTRSSQRGFGGPPPGF